MPVVDRAGSNRLKLQQQGFRLDMSLTIQFSSPSLSLGSLQFADMDMQPILTENAVMTVNCLHYCSHMPTYTPVCPCCSTRIVALHIEVCI